MREIGVMRGIQGVIGARLEEVVGYGLLEHGSA